MNELLLLDVTTFLAKGEALAAESCQVSVVRLSLYYIREVTLLIQSAEKKEFITFNYCHFFAGSLSNWSNCQLDFSYIREKVETVANRYYEADFFQISDRHSGFSIKSRNVIFGHPADFDLLPVKINVAQPTLANIEQNLSQAKKLLAKWPMTKAMVWNSDLAMITIAIEPYQQGVAARNSLHIKCIQPTMYRGEFSWFIAQPWQLSYHNGLFRLEDPSHGYFVECVDIKFEEVMAY